MTVELTMGDQGSVRLILTFTKADVDYIPARLVGELFKAKPTPIDWGDLIYDITEALSPSS